MRLGAIYAIVFTLALLAVATIVAAWKLGDGSRDAANDSAPQAQGEEQRDPAVAPAFTAEDLTAEPTTRWITNGGTVWNQRYSPLDEIDTSNVADLKGVWMTDLGGSGLAAKYSQEAQPIFYDGVLYVPTGEDEVFAVDVETGEIKWRYDAQLEQRINTVCCGWLSRGVALGEGMVFLGQLDGKLVALDQRTGEVAWETQVGRWQEGYTITAAPLYYDGMVITGVSGGEFSIRGRVQAYDAKTGERVWVFNTVPGPGEFGHDTWPQDNDAWTHGGAPMWQTPAVDPELGLIYFSTGNASPDLDGSNRAGDNLFAASIVALEAKTGKYRWHFQQVHHDIWDYDAPSPVILFDVEIDGEQRKGLAEASKTGWLYLLDRETGEPLLPIEEQPVPQDPEQKTSPTQPIPSYPPFIDHRVTAEDVAEIRKLAEANTKPGAETPRVVNGENVYTPFGQDITVIVPGPQGGTNWQPVSYNPETELFYVCGMRSVSGYTRSGDVLAEAERGQTADFGSVFTTTGFGSQKGVFVAIDAKTGEQEWRQDWPESCYSGSVTTGGGLVFVGRNSGELEAYDAEDGERLWSFQTGAGANTTPTVFEWQGTQYLAFAAGGNSLAATAKGDNLWLFSLEGTLGPVEAGSGGEGQAHAGGTPAEPEDSGEGDAQAGEQVFADNCAGCHGLSGTGGNGGPDLTTRPAARNVDDVMAIVRNGRAGMPAFRDTLEPQQIRDVAAHVVENIAGGGG
ncbi:MAG: quinonprotein alcohol dehydrogenase [Gaiellaceae bacterium]|nr:quinonprotein alcohol dehydrogenase [Gaiellaceae bacterium]